MTCRLFGCLSRWSGLLPAALESRLRPHLDRHAAGCLPCREQQSRLDAIPQLLRAAYEQEAAAYVARGPLVPVPAAPAPIAWWRRPAIAAALVTAGLLIAALAVSGPRRPVQAVRHPVESGPPALGTPADGQQATHGGSVPTVVQRSGERPPASRGVTAPMTVSTGRQQRPPAAQRGTHVAASPAADDRYLDGRDPRFQVGWLAGSDRSSEVLKWLDRPLPLMKDDFVAVAFPAVASADRRSPEVASALRKYEKEAQVVDARLFKRISVHQKGASLEDLCADLETQTGVRLRAGRGVADEKVTVLVKERPAREVMRQVARLFGYLWSRSGEEGAYRYELIQDLKGQLAEEEMRRHDFDAALLAMHAGMDRYRPYLDQSPADLRGKAEQANGEEVGRLLDLSYQWGGFQVYDRLTPAQIAALRDGQKLTFAPQGSGIPDFPDMRVDRSLPQEWKQSLIDSLGVGEIQAGAYRSLGLLFPNEAPTAEPYLRLKLDRSELGQVSLVAEAGAMMGLGGKGAERVLSTGKSPSVEKPDNAVQNRALRGDPAFKKSISLRPEPSCPAVRDALNGKHPDERDPYADPATEAPHVMTADLWEAVHEATGMPIVADFYTHLYPLDHVRVEKATVFDALCKVADEAGCRWRKDGEFLLVRSTSFFWDKLKEVPNRLLVRWQRNRTTAGGLPLEDVVEMLSLADQQLDSEITGKGILHCWDLLEWGVFAKGSTRPMSSSSWTRPFYRLLTLLSPQQLRRAQEPAGLPFDALNPAQQQAYARTETGLLGSTLRVKYVPSGRYVWEPLLPKGTDWRVQMTLPIIAERTKAAALAEARKLYPGTTENEIHRYPGVLFVTFTDKNGTPGRTIGRPPIYFRAE